MRQELCHLLHYVLNKSTNRLSFSSMSDWFMHYQTITKDADHSVDRAIIGGFQSKQMAFAFTSGYQSAVTALFNSDPSKLASICISEEGGNHPRAIQTTLTKGDQGYLINGHKKFVSGGPQADLLFIACMTGQDDQGRPKLVLTEVPADTNGVKISPMPTLPFIPEIEHGQFSLSDVSILPQQILAGDGYSTYIKPFRTVEDLHVLAATAGHRLGHAMKQGWGEDLIERHISLLLSLRSLGFMPYTDPAMHIALSGCRREFKRLLAEGDTVFEQKAPAAYALWQRDKHIFSVGRKAHEIRTEKAWDTFS